MRLIYKLLISTICLNLLLAQAHSSCDYNIVESMPDGLELNDPAGVVRTADSLIEMVNNASESLQIASFYIYLTPPAEFADHPSAAPGKALMDAIIGAAKRGVKLELVVDAGSDRMGNRDDIKALQQVAKVRFLNMSKLIGSGVMHSKFMIVDNRTFYLGSSNFDWRSYTQIKEMGITFKDCQPLAIDLLKIFRVYMLIAEAGKVPDEFTDDLRTEYNLSRPFELKMRDHLLWGTFLGGSPPAFSGKSDWTQRTDDIEGLLNLIHHARGRISISVMNYSPRLEFVYPKKYWPVIEDALREAASVRGVDVQLLFSNWTGTKPSELAWYRSLNAINSRDFKHGRIHVKLFKVPAFDDFQKRVPFARVKHDKYMVTEEAVYLGTSNWSGDYFTSTAGVSLVFRPKNTTRLSQFNTDSIVTQFQNIFDRDFNSEYAHEVPWF